MLKIDFIKQLKINFKATDQKHSEACLEKRYTEHREPNSDIEVLAY